eukprot:2235740-Rhodomonas_salina.1
MREEEGGRSEGEKMLMHGVPVAWSDVIGWEVLGRNGGWLAKGVRAQGSDGDFGDHRDRARGVQLCHDLQGLGGRGPRAGGGADAAGCAPLLLTVVPFMGAARDSPAMAMTLTVADGWNGVGAEGPNGAAGADGHPRRAAELPGGGRRCEWLRRGQGG